jgi:parvulin-like peptidyl-prolyl isomerase
MQYDAIILAGGESSGELKKIAPYDNEALIIIGNYPMIYYVYQALRQSPAIRNISKYSEEGGIQISHILVDTEKEARDILAKLNGGADFADMARQYSTCPSKEQGGDLGLVNENKNFVPEFKEAALKLQPGEITKEPVKTEHGYHLIKAGDKKEARVKSFDEVKNSVMVDLNNEKKDKAYNDYLNNLYEKAEIKDLTK